MLRFIVLAESRREGVIYTHSQNSDSTADFAEGMAESWQEALASVRVLVCIAKADGEISASERALLTEAIAQMQGEQASVTLEDLLTEAVTLTQLLSEIITPDAQQALSDAARSIAEQGGIHPQQQQLLDQIQSTFRSTLADHPGRVRSDRTVEGDDYDALLAGIEAVTQHHRKARELVFDYALGAAVIGLIPLQGILIFQVLAVMILLIKMRRDLKALWGFPKGQGVLAFVGSWFGSLGAWAIALMAWLTLLGLGAFVPHLGSLARAAAFSTLIWAQGQVTNQFYVSSRRMDPLAFQRLIRSSSQPADPHAKALWRRR